MNKYVVKTMTGETLYIHAAYFQINKEDEVVNFYDRDMRFVSMVIMKNVICLYIEPEEVSLNQEEPDDGNKAAL